MCLCPDPGSCSLAMAQVCFVKAPLYSLFPSECLFLFTGRSTLWVNVVASMLCCLEVAKSGLSLPTCQPHYPQLTWATPRWGRGHYGHLSPSLRIWTKAKVGLPGTKCRRNAVFPEQYPSWLPVMACVLPSPGKLITA